MKKKNLSYPCSNPHLHSNDGVNEEQHGYQQANVGKSLQCWMNEDMYHVTNTYSRCGGVIATVIP